MPAFRIKPFLLTAVLSTMMLACSTHEPISATSSNRNSGASLQLPDPLAAGWNGKSVCELLPSSPGQRVLKCTFPPGVGHERHFHAPHFGYALSGGRMQLTDERGTRQVDLATGSHYTSLGTEWHEVVNVGSTTVQYLIVESLHASQPTRP